MAQDATAAQPQAEPAKEKKICRATVDTGSRLGRRKVCHTRAEWDALDTASQRDAQYMQSRSRSD